MTQNKIIVITGGIASGKSSVCNILKKYNEIVISSDEKASGIYDIMEVKEKVIKEFGNLILDENGNVDKAKLRLELFENPEKLPALNKITHPVIMDRVKNCVDMYKNKRIFVEIPVYFESKALIDKVLDLSLIHIFNGIVLNKKGVYYHILVRHRSIHINWCRRRDLNPHGVATTGF